jgi:hypothetical protein
MSTQSSKSLDIGAAVNSAASWVGQSPILNGTFGNPFIAALVVTALVAIIIMGIFHYKVTAGNFKQSMKVGFYTYCATLLVLYLHHYIVLHNIQESSEAANVRQFFGGLDLTSISPQSTTGGFVNVHQALQGSEPHRDSEPHRGSEPYRGFEPHIAAPTSSELPGLRQDNVLNVVNVPVVGRAVVGI